MYVQEWLRVCSGGGLGDKVEKERHTALKLQMPISESNSAKKQQERGE